MTSASFKIQIFPQGVAAIRFRGSIEPSLVTRAMDECLTRGCQAVVIDFTEASHVSNATFNQLGVQREVLQTKGGRLAVVEPKGSIAILFDMLALRNVYPTYPTLDDALRELVQVASGTRKIKF